MRFKMIYARPALFNAVSSYMQTVFPRLLSLPLSCRVVSIPITYPSLSHTCSLWIESFQEWKVKGYIFFFKEFEIWIRRWKWIGLKNIWNRIYFIAFNCSWNILSRFKIISILYIYLWCVSLLFELFSLLNFTILFYIFYK